MNTDMHAFLGVEKKNVFTAGSKILSWQGGENEEERDSKKCLLFCDFFSLFPFFCLSCEK
jgi:hypothetical protein